MPQVPKYDPEEWWLQQDDVPELWSLFLLAVWKGNSWVRRACWKSLWDVT